VVVPAGQEVTLVEKYQNRNPRTYSTQTRIQLRSNQSARHSLQVVLERTHPDIIILLEVDAGRRHSVYSHVFNGRRQIRNTIQVI